MKLAKKGKIQLIRGAAQRGPGVLARQTWLALMDSFVRKRHLVFRLDGKGSQCEPQVGLCTEKIREILTLDDLSREDMALLNDPSTAHDWGAVAWLKTGWRLWVLEDEGQIQALAWVRDAAHSGDFFVPIGAQEELFWHVYVLPQHRGKNLQEKLWRAVAAGRVSEGVEGFFTNCRDYNLPSRRNILKMGFVPVGHCDENRLTRRRIWRGY